MYEHESVETLIKNHNAQITELRLALRNNHFERDQLEAAARIIVKKINHHRRLLIELGYKE